MLDYKECSLAEFEAAMQQKNADISTISSETLAKLWRHLVISLKKCMNFVDNAWKSLVYTMFTIMERTFTTPCKAVIVGILMSVCSTTSS